MQPETNSSHPPRPGPALLSACVATFLGFLDATVTNLAIPDIVGSFGIDIGAVSWVVTLYMVLFAACLAPAGGLADLLGRERLLFTGVAAFTVASLLAAVAPTFTVLLVARGMQGVAAALIIPASLGLVLASTAPARRAAAIGLWSASGALAAAIGPSLGGVLVELLGWRSLFCLNLPIGFWLAYRTWKSSGSPGVGTKAPDGWGSLLVVISVGLAVLAVAEGPVWGWRSAATTICLLAAVVSAVAAVMRARRHPRPALEVRLWRSRTYAFANLSSLFYGAGLYASLLVGVLYLVQIWRYSELQAGLAMTPGAVAATVVGLSLGRARRQPSARSLVVGGSLLIAGTAAWLALTLPAAPAFVAVWLPAGLLMGVGAGAASVGTSGAAALSVSPAFFASATGLNLAARQLGGAIGIAMLVAILGPEATGLDADRFGHVYAAIAAVSALTCLTGLQLAVPRLPPGNHDDAGALALEGSD